MVVLLLRAQVHNRGTEAHGCLSIVDLLKIYAPSRLSASRTSSESVLPEREWFREAVRGGSNRCPNLILESREPRTQLAASSSRPLLSVETGVPAQSDRSERRQPVVSGENTMLRFELQPGGEGW